MLKGGLVLIWELDMNLEPTLLETLKYSKIVVEINVSNLELELLRGF